LNAAQHLYREDKIKEITEIKCLVPFEHFQISVGGYCYSCCFSWTKVGHIGRLVDKNGIMQVWNSKRIQYIRRCILEDRLEEVCDLEYCPMAIKNRSIRLNDIGMDDPRLNKIIRQIKAGKTRLDTAPYTFELSHNGACNLNCIMCESNTQNLRKDKFLDRHIFSKLLPGILPQVSELILSGYGDPLYNRHSRRFLQELDAERYPALKINLITNGLLFTKRLWESIKHNHYHSINISVDACAKNTYENIRKNGNWDVLLRNLEFIRTLRKQRVFSRFILSFIVMKSNYREIKKFARFCLKLGCDTALYQKIFGHTNIIENINFSRNKKVMIEIADMLTDPIFRRKQIDTALIEDYRRFKGKKTTALAALYTRLIECLFYYPILILHLLGKKYPVVFRFLYRFFQLLKIAKLYLKINKME
jgi:MoaA/NifB/PqqE/SkfB family radical SAM enzyme